MMTAMFFWPVVVFAVLTIISVTLLLGTVIFHFVVLRCPFVPTSRSVARAMVDLARLRGTERVYDLGAGDGAILIEALRRYPNLRATGIERVWTVRLLGAVRALLSGIRIDLRGGDFLRANVSDADVIFLYLFPHLLKELEERFHRQLKPGTIVISHTFRFPTKSPEKIHRCPSGDLILRYVW